MKLRAKPLSVAKIDQTPIAMAMSRTRLRVSASRASGKPATMYTAAKPNPLTRPNSKSLSARSSLIACPIVSSATRSMIPKDRITAVSVRK